jgi:plasmid replication initiation protein
METKNLVKKAEYVIQPNEISQAIYNLSPYARKLLAMAMSFISFEKDEYSAIFESSDFFQDLGLEIGGNQIKYLKAAMRDCASGFVEINTEDGKWKIYPWLDEGEISSVNEMSYEGVHGESITIHIHFNPKLGNLLKAFKKGYSRLNLIDLGKIQSRYAIRFYELAVSYAGFAGKEGNKENKWYFEMTLQDIRIRFDVDKNKYKATKDFRVYVIEKPIEEINAAEIGIRIEPEYIRRKKWIVAIKFNCCWIDENEPRIVNPEPATETAKEEEALKKAFPEEFEELLKEVTDVESKHRELFPLTPEMLEKLLNGKALRKLKEKHPDFAFWPKSQGRSRKKTKSGAQKPL